MGRHCLSLFYIYIKEVRTSYKIRLRLSDINAFRRQEVSSRVSRNEIFAKKDISDWQPDKPGSKASFHPLVFFQSSSSCFARPINVRSTTVFNFLLLVMFTLFAFNKQGEPNRTPPTYDWLTFPCSISKIYPVSCTLCILVLVVHTSTMYVDKAGLLPENSDPPKLFLSSTFLFEETAGENLLWLIEGFEIEEASLLKFSIFPVPVSCSFSNKLLSIYL